MITTPLDELPAFTGGERRCSTATGKVEMFECGATDLLSFLPPSQAHRTTATTSPISSLWGWTDPQTKQEWALLGRRDGTTFVDITNPDQPEIGRRPAAHRRRAAQLLARDQGLQGPRVHRVGRRRPARHPDLRPHAAAHDEAAAERPAAESRRPMRSTATSTACTTWSSTRRAASAIRWDRAAAATTCGGGLHMIDITRAEEPEVRRLLRGHGNRTRRAPATSTTRSA